MHALETDASIDAMRHTAAGDALGVSVLPLFPLWGAAIPGTP